MDVDGITGGYNFQHAWASGWIAAQHIGEVRGEK
jgi:predicted flavoprotein YhiN